MTPRCQKVKRLIAFLVFLFLVWEVFLHCTYLFRNVIMPGESVSRLDVMKFYGEEKDSLDIVYIGGSNAYRYWDCMQAWKEYGITSYDYGVSGASGATYLFMIKEVEKVQNPQLVIVDVRPLLSRFLTTESDSADVKNFIDSMDYDLSRLFAVEYIRKLNKESIYETLPRYIDLITYHNNLAALSNEQNWRAWNNRIGEANEEVRSYKGFHIYVSGAHVFLNKPEFGTQPIKETVELNEIAKKIYIDMLEYCRNNNINLLLTASPFVLEEQDIKELNMMEEIAVEYGVPFLNSNEYYEEMLLDFTTDFYNYNHVNIFGAEKYTEFMAQYLIGNYDLPDHRDDEAYLSWDELYERYSEDADNTKAGAKEVIADKKQALEDEVAMRELEGVENWLLLADNENMTLFITTYQSCENIPSVESELCLKQFGLTKEIITESESYIGVYSAGCLYGSVSEMSYSGSVGIAGTNLPDGKLHETQADYLISVDGTPQTVIDGKDYFSGAESGIHIVVFDNNVNEVIDSVILQISEDGRVTLTHQSIEGV